MAIATPTKLVDESDTVDATSFSVTSATYTAGRLYVMFVLSTTGAATGNTPTVSTEAGTWTQIITKIDGANVRRMTAFWLVPTSTSTTGLTHDFAGQTQTRCAYSVVEVASGFAPAPIGDSDSATGTSATTGAVPTLTLQGPLSLVLAAFYHLANEATTTNMTGELTDLAGATPNAAFSVGYGFNDTDPDASWSTSSVQVCVGVEILPDLFPYLVAARR